MEDSLLDVAEARRKLLESFKPVSTEQVLLAQAYDRVLAEAIHSPSDLPAFDYSAMDGYAVHVQDISAASPSDPAVLPVSGDIPAGKKPESELRAGSAVRVMTGAPLPDGADGVVPVEYTDQNYRQPGLPLPEKVLIFNQIQRSENVRWRGEDVRAGELVIQPGIRLRPQEIGFLAMLGIGQAPVFRRPRVALLSTGSELLPVEAPLLPGTIHDANGYSLSALIQGCGAYPLYLGITADRLEAIVAALDQAVSLNVDMIISSAGVSVGAFDYVRFAVEKHGQLGFWRVNMRPGKPVAFGHYGSIPILGLPGNPVSAFVSAEVFVRPALMKLAGLQHWERPSMRVQLAEPIDSDGRESYLRAVVEKRDGLTLAHLTGHQGSGNLRSLVQANALLIIPSGVKSLPAGVEVNAWPLD